MTVLPILLWPAQALRVVAAPVGTVSVEVRALAADMFDAMRAARGRGLAAPQVGRPLRLFVMDVGWKDGASDPIVAIDPVILEASTESDVATEGCLSLPGVPVEVVRPSAVTLAYTDLDGVRQSRRFDGFAARCVQHERDHLDGILCIDRLPQAGRAAIEAGLARLAG